MQLCRVGTLELRRPNLSMSATPRELDCVQIGREHYNECCVLGARIASRFGKHKQIASEVLVSLQAHLDGEEISALAARHLRRRRSDDPTMKESNFFNNSLMPKQLKKTNLTQSRNILTLTRRISAHAPWMTWSSRPNGCCQGRQAATMQRTWPRTPNQGITAEPVQS